MKKSFVRFSSFPTKLLPNRLRCLVANLLIRNIKTPHPLEGQREGFAWIRQFRMARSRARFVWLLFMKRSSRQRHDNCRLEVCCLQSGVLPMVTLNSESSLASWFSCEPFRYTRQSVHDYVPFASPPTECRFILAGGFPFSLALAHSFLRSVSFRHTALTRFEQFSRLGWWSATLSLVKAAAGACVLPKVSLQP